MDNRTPSISKELGTRWWIAGPGEDESLRSIVERAERFYGGQSEGLRRHLWPRATPLPDLIAGLDALPAGKLFELARLIGVTPRSLYPHRLLDHPMLLLESERRAYCPLCWRDDQRAGKPVVFRRAWAGVFTLNCSRHGVPLHWAAPMVTYDALEKVQLRPRSKVSKRILQSIGQLASVMEAALQGEDAWPVHWQGNALAARALLMRAVVNLGCTLEHAPFSNVTAHHDLAAYVGTPRKRIEPLQESPWESVRALGPPAWRRAALWLVARYVMPELEHVYWPLGLPADAFGVFDAQWNNVPSELRSLRRVRRYGAALRRMCNPFLSGQGIAN